MPRFYIPPASWTPSRLMLEAAEAHHALQVLRMKPGDRAVVFNGRGEEATVQIGDPQGRDLPVIPQQFARTEPVTCEITLGQAVPKGKTMDLIVQKATELGATRIAPLLSDRTVVQLTGREATSKQEKWQRTALEACKQCGRNWLPEVLTPCSIGQFLANHHGEFDLMLIASLQPEAQTLKEHLRMVRQPANPGRVLILIGPEGDFTPAEIGEAQTAGALPLTLGSIVFRSETAALYCLSVLGHELFDS